MGLIDLIFPRKCFGCSKEGKYFCEDCLAKQRKVRPVCPVCKRASIDGFTHTKCHRKLSLDGLITVWGYGDAFRKAILAIKYKYAFDIAGEIADVVVGEINKMPVFKKKSIVLIPIPSDKLRKNQRGFNQTEEIGKIVAGKLDWEYEPNLLVKKTITLPQTELNRKARLINLRGAFGLNPNLLLPNTSCLVLFDDVYTTGSTLKEACKVLKRRGFRNVWGLTLAKS